MHVMLDTAAIHARTRAQSDQMLLEVLQACTIAWSIMYIVERIKCTAGSVFSSMKAAFKET
jgi:hypothetical protein